MFHEAGPPLGPDPIPLSSCFTKPPTGGRQREASGGNSLALEQHVGLPEQRDLGPQAPLAVGQVADVAAQLLLALPAAL